VDRWEAFLFARHSNTCVAVRLTSTLRTRAGFMRADPIQTSA
jgi:hypothetical protein